MSEPTAQFLPDITSSFLLHTFATDGRDSRTLTNSAILAINATMVSTTREAIRVYYDYDTCIQYTLGIERKSKGVDLILFTPPR